MITTTMDEITEGELWYELEKELERQKSEVDLQAQAEEAAAAKEITEVKVLGDAGRENPISSLDVSENLRFYLPGRIMHMVSGPLTETTILDPDALPREEHVGIYETPRELYSNFQEQ
ncbi:hypothetical protein SLEP1_g40112 [Rubroshorea leprosula]|uniref:Uncharacterized protein n=1 Tax=Rubroshorea leprosula TaxID=152421 RepID=A0AAV5L2F6_9ROSI|nr:hypothetical protein SLEP1_g40112 [Rubroshorea leprosula]